MAHRVFNFSAGPATLPLDVLKIVQDELLDYHGTGMSIIESSHRSAAYDEINEQAMSLARELMGLDDSYHIMFIQGGASTQFAMIPMNFLPRGNTAAYVDTGSWSSKAIEEAAIFGKVHLAASSKESDYDHIPGLDDIIFSNDSHYLHITSNNTIFGTQYQEFPVTNDLPLICDMSSDIMSKEIDFTNFDMIYAGAQKNIGPAGVTLVAMKDSLLKKCLDGTPTMLDYRTHAKKKSLYNTPPVFAIYVMKLVFEWIKKQGGLKQIEKTNNAKQERIYQMLDLHPDFYRGTVRPESRSWMNATFRLPSEDLEKQFIAEAKTAGFVGLKGHRSVGGVRVSMYNAMPLEGCERLGDFMTEFRKKNS